QVVEYACEPAQLATLVGDGQALAQIGGGDARGAVAHLDNGREALAREKISAEARGQERERDGDVERVTCLLKRLVLLVQGARDDDRVRPPASLDRRGEGADAFRLARHGRVCATRTRRRVEQPGEALRQRRQLRPGALASGAGGGRGGRDDPP